VGRAGAIQREGGASPDSLWPAWDRWVAADQPVNLMVLFGGALLQLREGVGHSRCRLAIRSGSEARRALVGFSRALC
jgi:hypothetical protein